MSTKLENNNKCIESTDVKLLLENFWDFDLHPTVTWPFTGVEIWTWSCLDTESCLNLIVRFDKSKICPISKLSWASHHQSGSQHIIQIRVRAQSEDWDRRILWLGVLLLSPLCLRHLSGTFSCPRLGSQNILVLTISVKWTFNEFPKSNFTILTALDF